MVEACGIFARAVGLCEASGCRSINADVTFAMQRLASHCPLVFDLFDRDED
jgi:hypothetical protein